MTVARSRLADADRHERQEGDDIRYELQELGRKARHLRQADRERGRCA